MSFGHLIVFRCYIFSCWSIIWFIEAAMVPSLFTALVSSFCQVMPQILKGVGRGIIGPLVPRMAVGSTSLLLQSALDFQLKDGYELE